MSSSHAAELRRRLQERLAALSPEQRAILQNGAAPGPAGAVPAGHEVISPRAPGATVPLTHAQELLWTLDRGAPGLAAYNLPRVYRLEGVLDRHALQRALDAIVSRHEILRTAFVLRDGRPVQDIRPAARVPVAVAEVSGSSPAEREASGEQAVRTAIRSPISLEEGVLLRATIVQVTPTDQILVLLTHHVASDGWSRRILEHELSAFYNGFVAGAAVELPPLRLQFGDYAVWERERLSGERLEGLLQYWREELATVPTQLGVPSDRPRGFFRQFEGARLTRDFSPDVNSRLAEASARLGASRFMVLLAAYYAVLARYTGRDDILVSVPMAERHRSELESVIGYLVNTLPIRARPSPELPFSGLVDQVRRAFLGADEHRDIPFETLAIEIGNREGHGPIQPQVSFTLAGGEGPSAFDLIGLTRKPVPYDPGWAKFELAMTVMERKAGFQAVLDYRTDLFDQGTAERFLGHYETLLRAALAEPESMIGALPLLTVPEQHQLDTWNATSRDYSSQADLASMVTLQAARTPNAPALSFGGRTLTYQALDQRVARLASYLRARGVGPEMVAALHVERSLNMVVAVLAIHRAGAAYLPLDPAYPRDRLRFMLADSGAVILVTQEALRGVLDPAVPVVSLDGDCAAIDQTMPGPETGPSDPDGLAYLIYTSGSTGIPKGVEVTHRNVVNFLSGLGDAIPFGPGRTLVAVTPLSFDISVLEMFHPLTTGGQVVVASRDTAIDPEALAHLLTATGATHLQATPATWRMLIDAGWPGHPGLVALCGGEALPPALASALLSRGVVLWNLYGPTETTIWATLRRVESSDLVGSAPISIGRPMSNVQAYVVDAVGLPLPIGIPGELLLGGDGVARGYHGRPELTAERFIPDRLGRRPGRRLYRTGDRASWREDGTIRFQGRLDHQVKLHGFRIELEEIESVLQRHPAVRQAVVTLADETIAGYVVLNEPVDDVALARHLRASLPEHMVPRVWIRLGGFPLNSSGKVDRKALPAPALAASVDPDAAPHNEEERALATLWASVLGRPAVGRNDDFMALGGHSLLAMRLIGRIEREMGVRLSLRRLAEHPTVAGLSQVIAAARVEGVVAANGRPTMSPVAEDLSPRTTLEAVLLEILSSLLPNQPVARGDGFLRLGGTPELGELVVRSLYEATGHRMPLELLLADASVDEITDYVLKTGYTEQNPDIVAIQPLGTQRAIFLLHGDLTGGGFYCHKIAKVLGPDQPLYAIPPRTPRPGDGIMTIDSMAAAHLAAIRKVQPRGPYRLAGYCIGGLVAFEMAHQLRQAGVAVEMLVLVDCRASNGRLERLRPVLRWFVELIQSDPVLRADRIAYLMGRLRTIETMPRWRAVLYLAGFAFRVIERRFVRAGRKLSRRPDHADGNPRSSLDQLAYHHWRAKYTYIPVRYEGRIDLVQATPSGQTPTDKTLGWGRLARDVVPQFPQTSHIRIVMTHLPAILRDAIGRVSAGEKRAPMTTSEANVDPKTPGGPEPAEYAFPASFSQRRLWFLHQLAPDSEAYNIAVSWVLHGPLDSAAFIGAWEDLLARHESLRTTFRQEQGEPMQVVSTTVHPAARLAFATLGASNGADRANRIKALASLEFTAPFDLEKGPLIRGRLIRVAEHEHVLLGAIHHIVSDAWSLEIFYRELAALYAARLAGEAHRLPDLEIQYPDFAVWQRDWLSGETLDGKLVYWREQLQGPLPLLELATDRARGSLQTFNGGQVDFVIPAADHDRLLGLCHKEGCTAFTGLLAAYAALLQRHTGQDDVVVGTPTTGRPTAEVEQVIGFFVNTLPLRLRIQPEETFRALLGRSRRVLLDGLANPDVPFEKLVEVLHSDGDRSRNPIFQTMLSVLERRANRLQLPGIRAERLTLTQGKAAKFDLQLTIAEAAAGEALDATFEFNSNLFDEQTIQGMAERFRVLLASAAMHPDRPVSELELLPEAEQRLLASWTGPAVSYPADRATHQLIAAQAAATPDAIAVSNHRASLSYAALDARANQLAHRLRELGVTPDSLVGICMERSPDLLVGLLGIWKAGAAYVPLDPAYPQERLGLVLDDSAATLVLTESDLLNRLPQAPGRRLLCLDTERGTLGALPKTAPPERATAESLAYVIYTSGTTGKPKGVEIPHRALINLLSSMRQMPGLGAEDVLLAVTTLSFDIAGLELFLPLLVGARVALASRDTASDPRSLAQEISDTGATVMQATPTTWRMLVEGGWDGEPELTALCGGEALSAELASQLLPRVAALWNLYGPTETTIWSTVSRVTPRTPVLLGHPIANTTVRVLDAHAQQAPIGVAGELCIGGAGVARGYRGRPDLTAERFISDPFDPKGRLYRTGDRGRWREDGTLEYLGRLDFQVKLRGHRIEPGDIESALIVMPEIVNAVVVLREETPGDPALVAFVVAAPGASIPSTTELRRRLRDTLPAVMVPQTIVVTDALPLTLNGKVDRKALMAPGMAGVRSGNGVRPANEDAVDEGEPRNTLEVLLREIWRGLLPGRPIGIHDDFFHLGGHSLLAAKMVNEVERDTGVPFPITRLFSGATIAQIADWLLSQASTDASPIVEVQGCGTGSYFFMVHGDFSGGGFYCRGIAKLLGAEHGVYAIPPYAPDGIDDTTSIEDMATWHLKAIREIQPHGPYRLGGYCIAGLVAFEIARHLRTAGETVDLLILADTSAANTRLKPIAPLLRVMASVLEPRDPVRRARRFGVLVQRFRSLLDLPPWRRALVIAGYPARVAARTLRPKPIAARLPNSEALDRLVEHHWNAKFLYFPQWYDGRVDLLWSNEEAAPVDDASRGWKGVAREVVPVEAPTNHLRLVFDDLPVMVRDAMTRLKSHG